MGSFYATVFSPEKLLPHRCGATVVSVVPLCRPFPLWIEHLRSQMSSAQSLSCVRLFVIPWIAGSQASLSSAVSWSLVKFMLIELKMPPNHLILCRPLLLLPSIFPSIRVFSSESALRIKWPSFRISPSNAYSGLISFRMDWLDLLAVQGTLKSLLQHRSLKASVLQCSPFFMAELPHLYMITGKIMALAVWTLASQSSKIHDIDFFTCFIDWES